MTSWIPLLITTDYSKREKDYLLSVMTELEGRRSRIWHEEFMLDTHQSNILYHISK